MTTLFVPAIEVGGTHVAAAAVDVSVGRVLEPTLSRRQLDSGASAREIIGKLVEAATSVVADAGHEAILGVAIPGPFDYAEGICRFDGVEKFGSLRGLDLGATLQERLDGAAVRIAFMNDADAFTLGELVSGAAMGHRRVVGITLGTGIGSGFLDGGRVMTGDPRVPPDGSVHLLTVNGRPLEETISRRALLREAKAAIGELPADADVLDVAQLARHGDQRAWRVFDEALSALGTALAPWLADFGASLLVVGGSMAGSWDVVERPLVAGIVRARPELAGLLVRRAARPEHAALIGAAVHAAAA